ncbi:MAG TPA: OmpA family protein [Bdellovibrio sp.]|uniref:OmpA family protein n=1 Tax=Bdellovibrio sp. TaxID=28201 RepID=UPI002F09105E
MKKLILASLLCAGSLAANAQDQSATSSTLQFSKEAVETEPRGIIPLIGAGGGYTGYDGSGNGSVEGTPSTVKLLGSYYFESPWVADVGYGFNAQSFSQSSAYSSNATNAAVELAARYRWQSRWQAGVVADQFFDQGINYGANQADAQFVGLQALKEFNLAPAWIARVGARAMALTNNVGQDAYMYLIDLQIGWNPHAYKTSAKSMAAQQPQPQQQTDLMDEDMEDTTDVAETAPVLRDISYSSLASAGAIEFSSAKYTVDKKDQQRLGKVAKVLNDNKDLLERVEVVGYADATGNDTANQKISLARAQQVKSILQKNGLKDVPVTAVGKGSSEATGGSIASDRRAELVFVGVKDEDALRRALASID